MATRERLAAACLADGKVKDAIAHYKRVLSDREKVLGRAHPATIATAASLSAAYQAAGRMPAAMQYAERCCADSERVLGPDHADTLARLVSLAHLYYAVGRVGDAEALLRRDRGPLRAGAAAWAPADRGRPGEPGQHLRALTALQCSLAALSRGMRKNGERRMNRATSIRTSPAPMMPISDHLCEAGAFAAT